MSGKYFWTSDMILINNCSRDSIEEVIYDLLENKEFDSTFTKINE